jgi:signal transduction histidine kinase
VGSRRVIIAFLIAIIGIIPIVLAISVLKIYKGSELGYALLLYMLSIGFWQLDIASLYLKELLPENVILWLFKIFRAGPTFMIPLVFYLSYVSIKKHSTNIKNKSYNRFLLSIFNRKLLILLTIWSTFVYFINMTKLGITGLTEVKIINTNTFFYFPEYGQLQFLYTYHTGSFIIFVLFTYLISRNIQNQYLKDFLGTFSFCSFLLFLSGLLNFIPKTGTLFSSLGVIIFSVIIIFSFVRMNTVMAVNYNRLMERQKKLDYSGNLTASLVHEVKNNVQIINGYSKLLNESTTISSQDQKMNEMIQLASQQLEELTQNYTKYINYQSIDFMMEDINVVIEQAIKITSEIAKENSVEISFDGKYRTLKAFVNQTNLKQVFVNLIKNSIEAFPEEELIRKIMISTDILADKIFINIMDTGKGIPTENWKGIFDPFTTSKKDGLGLGLPFVKKVIYEHRGDINIVESNQSGTKFQITLPQYSFSDFHI